jgi:hypothetical protein
VDIRYLEGETKGILIVAPHGPYETKDDKIKYRNDKRTGIIAEDIHKILGCFTIINDAYIKPDEDEKETASLKDKRLDLFKVKQAEKVPGYLKAIKDAVDNHDGKTLVIWLHGIHDNNAGSEKIEHVKANLMKEGDGDLHALIGYGQGKPTRYTAEQKTVDTIRDELTKRGLRTVITRKDAGNYRGRDTDRLNQWFRKGKNTFDKVETFQIEIREKDFREDDEQCRSTARIIADAISATLVMKPIVMEEAVPETQPVEPTASDTNATEDTVPTDASVPVQVIEPEIVVDDEHPLVEQTAPDKDATEGTLPTAVPVLVQNIEAEIVQDDEDLLVADAFEFLKNSFRQHFHEAMLEAGRYLVENFYDKDYERARQGKKPKKKGSLNKLIERLQANSGDAPSKTWIYDALKLAVDDHFYNVEGGTLFRAFGKLGHTQKLRIAYVKQPEIKERLIEEIADQEEPLTDKALRTRIAEEKEKILKNISHAHIKKEFQDADTGIDLTSLPPREKLLQLSPGDLTRLFNLAMNKVDESEKAVLTYGKALHEFGIVLAETNGKDVLGKGHFQDWTKSKNNVNICTGCKNDCLYCYMKPINARNPRLKQSADWHNWEIRPKDVDKVYRLKDGLVGFPSSHDIFPDILDAYLTVLGKLLRAGNQVLIVSKPRLDCIRQICDACHFFKDKILFRFTIGAMDDEILKFWEPNAPGYEERRACLEFAYNQGFRTSISMEPMLDTPRIEEQIADLRQFVRKDENIWLGTMGYLEYIKKGADDDLTAAIAKVKAGQTVKMLTAIYQTYKDDRLIKWKTEALKIITGKQQKGEAAK